MDTNDPDYAFDSRDFDRVRRLIFQRAGISLHDGKRAMVYSRLARHLRATGEPSFDAYLGKLERARGPEAEPHWQDFVNCLTTNLTAFFRESHHFPLLAERLATGSDRRLRIWCSAASTGEEPYSLAMTVVETLGPDANVEIVCSDIDTAVLERARRGVYPLDARGLTSEQHRRHFQRGVRANDGRIRANATLRRIVSFRPHNLMDERWDLGGPFDVVFCRNVMIYFDAPTQRRVLERMHRAIVPQGLFFAGHSENFTSSRDLFRLRGKTVYERV